MSTLILIILAVALFAFGFVCGLERCDHISRWEEEAREALAAETKRREEAEDDNARLREALDGLQRSEAAYRMAHDAHGDGSLVAGRCWDLMRRAGDIARAALAPKGSGGA